MSIQAAIFQPFFEKSIDKELFCIIIYTIGKVGYYIIKTKGDYLMIDNRIESKCTQRLNRIEGQIRGIAGMVKQKRYCIDIILQIAAAESALHKLSEIIMRNHLETCVLSAFRSSNEADRKAKVDELMQVYSKFRIK